MSTNAGAQTGSDTRRAGRERLIDAAEQLMVEHGIDAASLREIQVASGHKNTAAVQYHFGDREGLVAAITERHLPPADERRNELLDSLVASSESPPVREVLRAMLLPLAEMLDDPSGRRWLRLVQQSLDRAASARGTVQSATVTAGLDRARLLIAGMLSHLPPEVLVTRAALGAALISRAFADRAREIDEVPGDPLLTNAAFFETLLDAIEAVLLAPVSTATQEILAGQAGE